MSPVPFPRLIPDWIECRSHRSQPVTHATLTLYLTLTLPFAPNYLFPTLSHYLLFWIAVVHIVYSFLSFLFTIAKVWAGGQL